MIHPKEQSTMAEVFRKIADLVFLILGWPFRRPFTVRLLNGLSSRLLRLAIPFGRKLTERRLVKGRPRSMWGVTPIITLPLKAEADRQLGIRSESVVWTTYVITRDFTWNLRWPAAVVHRLNPELLNGFGKVVMSLALLRYDIFHLFNDKGFLWPTRYLGLEPKELDILKEAGKSTYVFVYGADIRTRETTLALGKWNFCTDCPQPTRFCICDDARGAAQMAETALRVNAVVTMGDMVAYAPQAQNMHYWPINFAKVAIAPKLATGGALVVAHAPNHTHFKGTAYLEAAIEALQAEGHDIILTRVSGVSNTEVIRLFGQADIIADQFIGGAYGYTALEAMARGKPVLCYVRSLDMVMAANDCPILQTRPETITDVLRWCLANREQLAVIGQQGRVYVTKYHSIEAIAGRFSSLYAQTGNFPKNLLTRWESFREGEAIRQSDITCISGWEHPFMVKDVTMTERQFETAQPLKAGKSL
jgi:hypothetical protein